MRKYLSYSLIFLSVINLALASDDGLESSLYASFFKSSYRPASSVSLSNDEIALATTCANIAYKILEPAGSTNLKAQELEDFLRRQQEKNAPVTLFEGETGHTVVSNCMVTKSKMGFVLETSSSLIIAFRGTVTKADILTDLYIWNCWMQKAYFNGNGRGKVHTGFNTTFESLKDSLQRIIFDALRLKRKQVIFTGHSMGGALANLGALWLAQECPAHGIREVTVKLVTFNAPRVGSEYFSSLLHEKIGLNNIARFTNGEREIASMIVFGTLGFKHAGTNVVLNNSEVSRIQGHRMASFLNGAAEKAYTSHNSDPKKANGVKTQLSTHRNYLYLYLMALHIATTEGLSIRLEAVNRLFWKTLGY